LSVERFFVSLLENLFEFIYQTRFFRIY